MDSTNKFIDDLQNRDRCCAWNGPSDYYENRSLNRNGSDLHDRKYFIFDILLYYTVILQLLTYMVQVIRFLTLYFFILVPITCCQNESQLCNTESSDLRKGCAVIYFFQEY